ncbi:efflux transporter outer membrane subunit [Sphaerotilus mobilis]|nr:efflux transporter outer membrane subunit [Sphaerotilus mobilis]
MNDRHAAEASPRRHQRIARGGAAACALALLTACATGPAATSNTSSPLAGPATAPDGGPARARAAAEALAPPAWAGPPEARTNAWPDAQQGWARFGGELLAGHVAQAQQAWPGVRAAQARVAQARALMRQADGARLPQLSAAASAGREREPGAGSAATRLGADLQLAWEVDLAGGLDDAARARSAAWQAARLDERSLRLQLAAEVATLHVELRGLHDRLALVHAHVANHRRLLALLEAQKQAGRANGLDLARQQAALSSSEAAIAPLRLRQRLALEALATLLARPGQDLALPALSLSSLRSDDLPAAGLPGVLLSRRPDVRRIEAMLDAADADVAAARAALWPRLTVGAQVGREAGRLALLTQPAAFAWSVAAELGAVLFDGGQRRAEVAQREAGRDALVQDYLQVALVAWREVHEALAVIEETGARQTHEQAAAQAGAEAVRLAELRLQAGAVDLGVVLEARRQLLLNEQALLDAREARARAHVLLYRALGGGWDGATASRATPPTLATLATTELSTLTTPHLPARDRP